MKVEAHSARWRPCGSLPSRNQHSRRTALLEPFSLSRALSLVLSFSGSGSLPLSLALSPAPLIFLLLSLCHSLSRALSLSLSRFLPLLSLSLTHTPTLPPTLQQAPRPAVHPPSPRTSLRTSPPRRAPPSLRAEHLPRLKHPPSPSGRFDPPLSRVPRPRRGLLSGGQEARPEQEGGGLGISYRLGGMKRGTKRTQGGRGPRMRRSRRLGAARPLRPASFCRLLRAALVLYIYTYRFIHM